MIILPIQVLPPYLYSRKWYVHCIYADVLHAFEDNTTNGDCYLWVQMGLKRPGWQSQPFPVHRPLYTQRLFLSYGCSCADMVVDLDSASETWGHPEAQKIPPSHTHWPACCLFPAACSLAPLFEVGLQSLFNGFSSALPAWGCLTAAHHTTVWSGILGPSILHTCPAQWGALEMEFVHSLYLVLILEKKEKYPRKI